MDVTESKDEVRKRLRKLREGLGVERRGRIDAGIFEALARVGAFAEAELVFAYVSMGSEIDTRAIIADAWERGVDVAVPRCVPGTREMEWRIIRSFDGLETSPFGVEEPTSAHEGPIDIAVTCNAKRSVALVPGFSFDEQGYRVGYGGGFYDVFLAQFPGTSIGLCRSCQLSDAPLPRDSHDRRVDMVVTENGCMTAVLGGRDPNA